jgi:hypothetical protein
MREESPNGGAKRRLVGGKGMAVAHLGVGEKATERGKLWPSSAFIDGGERGATVVPHVGDKAPTACQSGSTMAHAGFLCPRSLTGGPRSTFEPVV